MVISLSLFLYIYLALLALFAFFTFFTIYHIIRFSFWSFSAFFATFLFLASIILVLFISFNYITEVNWQQTIEFQTGFSIFGKGDSSQFFSK